MEQAQKQFAGGEPVGVDQALMLFQQHEGRPFTGKDPAELDRLHEMASSAAGSPLGRSWRWCASGWACEGSACRECMEQGSNGFA